MKKNSVVYVVSQMLSLATDSDISMGLLTREGHERVYGQRF